jgi:uncharacterized protein with HEPN domain
VSRSDQELVRDALEHIEVLRSHLCRGDLDESIIADAVNMRLSAAIESLSQTSPEFRTQYFAEDWQLMKATRNRISHGYSFVDQSIIQLTIENRLPSLEAQLHTALQDLEQS